MQFSLKRISDVRLHRCAWVKALILGLAFFALGACSDPYPLLYNVRSPDSGDVEGENHIFTGRVVDSHSNEPIEGATIRLELLRLTMKTRDDMWDTFKGPSKITEIETSCHWVDRLGSTEAYPVINYLYRKNEEERFRFLRDEAITDSTGRFALESTERRYSTPTIYEASIQRVVVKAEGYQVLSQGVLSNCGPHLRAIKPVRLVSEISFEKERDVR
ncbi:hypothetical protein CRI94_00025 [Longibacter salinarum]|uniref:Uncharacterized protein n=1 Tax=Longibacter salinarum TaxID=1850348 RepID=A0A2A8D185_9BACT|nr:hypothetical protein [Longibacter salinarum]PEN14722.1 hypothetical protein CRI94_00025 [Longibacter salinarum]